MITVGYVIMRLALVGQWLRAARTAGELRSVCLKYAAGITTAQLTWIAYLSFPKHLALIGFAVLIAAELAVPIWAEHHKSTPWNAHHITERYGLFTLILLGESILASANAMIDALHEGHHLSELLAIAAFGLIIAAGMWWVYFSRKHHHHIDTLASSLRYGYFHYLIFTAVGAYSAGIEVAIDTTVNKSHLQGLAANATLGIPVAVFLLGIWWLTLRTDLGCLPNLAFLGGVVVVASGIFAPSAGITIALGRVDQEAGPGAASDSIRREGRGGRAWRL